MQRYSAQHFVTTLLFARLVILILCLCERMRVDAVLYMQPKTAGFCCTFISSGTIHGYPWRNATHYYGVKSAVAADETKDCYLGVCVETDERVSLCQDMYPSGWTCKEGRFNKDLIAFVGKDVDDCELRDFLSLISTTPSDANVTTEFVNTEEVDAMCLQVDMWNKLNLSMTTLDLLPDVSDESVKVSLWCAPENSGQRTELVIVANSTDYLTYNDPLPINGASCLYKTEPRRDSSKFCDSDDTSPLICAEDFTSAVAAAKFRSKSCLDKELVSLYVFDESWAFALYEELCGRRKLEYVDDCSSTRYFHNIVIKHNPIVGNDFHIHHRNAQDLRYYTTTPAGFFSGACAGSLYNWNRHSLAATGGGDRTLNSFLVTCSSQTPILHVSGNVAGSLRIRGYVMSGTTSCVYSESAGYVRLSASSPCYTDLYIGSPGPSCNFGPSAYYVRNACAGNPLPGTGAC